MAEYRIWFTLEEKFAINKITGYSPNQGDYYIRVGIRSKPLFKTDIDPSTDITQRISDKIGGFYDIGMSIIPYVPPLAVNVPQDCVALGENRITLDKNHIEDPGKVQCIQNFGLT